MLKYVLRRAAIYIVMTFVVTSAAFMLAASYLKPGIQMEQQTPRPTPEQVRNSLTQLGLDPERPVILRYFDWLGDVFLRWDWGRSPNGGFINQGFGDRVAISFQLIIVAAILTFVIGVALGVYTASRQYKVSDRVITGYSYLTFIVPPVVAYLIIQLGAIALNDMIGTRVLFVTGISDPTVTGFWPMVWDRLAHYIVPVFALTVFGWAGYQVSQRQFLLDNLNADFVRTARATGLSKAKAIRRHALRVSFIPTAQSVAFTIPGLFAGSYFAEIVFNWPGLGQWSLEAISNNDVMGATAMVAYGSIIFAIGAILADFAISIVDPRVRVS